MTAAGIHSKPWKGSLPNPVLSQGAFRRNLASRVRGVPSEDIVHDPLGSGYRGLSAPVANQAGGGETSQRYWDMRRYPKPPKWPLRTCDGYRYLQVMVPRREDRQARCALLIFDSFGTGHWTCDLPDNFYSTSAQMEK